MINFIICDDEKDIAETVKDIITKEVFKTSLNYKIHIFTNYDDDFFNLMNSNIDNKIYILDIEVNNKTGLEIAKEIRKNDWDSVILILTAHYELETLAFKSKILLFDFISKFDLYSEKIKENIRTCINKVLKDDKLVFKINRVEYQIYYKDILYIVFDPTKRKSIVITTNDKYEVNETLSSIYNRLHGNFRYSHRACVINKDRVKEKNLKDKLIIFDNNDSTDLLSRKYMREFDK